MGRAPAPGGPSGCSELLEERKWGFTLQTQSRSCGTTPEPPNCSWFTAEQKSRRSASTTTPVSYVQLSGIKTFVFPTSVDSFCYGFLAASTQVLANAENIEIAAQKIPRKGKNTPKPQTAKKKKIPKPRGGRRSRRTQRGIFPLSGPAALAQGIGNRAGEISQGQGTD